MKTSGNSSGPARTDPPSKPPAAPSRRRFALTGPSRAFDPSTTPVRADLADVRVADQVFAPHYAAPLPRAVVAATSLTATRDGEPIGALNPGDCFEVLEMTAAHAWGVARDSGLVGYVALGALAPAQA